jgi:hypothetical protein
MVLEGKLRFQRSVLATRKPTPAYRSSVPLARRSAERISHASSNQQPPRYTRRLQSPLFQALPSSGAPW